MRGEKARLEKSGCAFFYKRVQLQTALNGDIIADMSNAIHAMKKTLKTYPKLMFPSDMYNTAMGSAVICAYIFSQDKSVFNMKKICAKWKKVQKEPEKYEKMFGEKTDIFGKACSVFGVPVPESMSIAFVVSNINCLFAPYIDGKLYPLREDGLYSQTLRSGKIYPIKIYPMKIYPINRKEKKDACETVQ